MKLIAETAWHHQGDVNFMHQLIDSILKCDINYIKLHLTIDLDEYMREDHPAYQTLKAWLFTETQWRGFIEQILKSGKKPMLLLNDIKSVLLAKEYNPELIEVHSVCLNDLRLLQTIGETFDDTVNVVIGVGGSSLYEIEHAIKIINKPQITLMHGFQNYPTKYEDINFGKVRRIMKMFPEYKHGYADHCAWNEPMNLLITMLGAALGMDYIEKHVTTNYGEERCDWNSAISIEMLNELSSQLSILKECEGNAQLAMNDGELAYAKTGQMKKAGVIINELSKGDILSADDIVFIRTGELSDLNQIEVVGALGKQMKEDCNKNTIITSNLFSK